MVSTCPAAGVGSRAASVCLSCLYSVCIGLSNNVLVSDLTHQGAGLKHMVKGVSTLSQRFDLFYEALAFSTNSVWEGEWPSAHESREQC